MMATVQTTPTFAVEGRRPHPSNFHKAPSADPFYDVARDGRILIARDAARAARMVLVRNWFAELRGRIGGAQR